MSPAGNRKLSSTPESNRKLFSTNEVQLLPDEWALRPDSERAHLAACHFLVIIPSQNKLFRPGMRCPKSCKGKRQPAKLPQNARHRWDLAMIDALTTACGIRHRRRTPKAAAAVAGKPGTIIEAMSLEQLLDEELLAQYRSTADAGEREQYINELFRRNYARVARWCLRFAEDRERAADLAQEIFVKAYQNLASFQGQSKFTTWLFVIARNHA
jgi:hypothetical protein